MKKVFIAMILLAMTVPVMAELPIDTSRKRNLETWKKQIANYSKRHYGDHEWRLVPTVIVLHYTVSEGFPWNLVNSDSFAGETPGLAVHYVVDGSKIWQILPDDVRSRGCYGINHKAINIEMVALDANDLARRKKTLETAASLTHHLMTRHGIPLNKIYSHQQVARMDKSVTPEALDLVNGTPYHKIDPGEQNMTTIKGMLKKKLKAAK